MPGKSKLSVKDRSEYFRLCRAYSFCCNCSAIVAQKPAGYVSGTYLSGGRACPSYWYLFPAPPPRMSHGQLAMGHHEIGKRVAPWRAGCGALTSPSPADVVCEGGCRLPAVAHPTPTEPPAGHSLEICRNKTASSLQRGPERKKHTFLFDM